MNALVRLCLAPVMFVLFSVLIGMFLVACCVAAWQWGPGRWRRAA